MASVALRARIKRDVYRDSVELMRLSAEVAARPGVGQFAAMMATPANLDLLRAGGLLAADLESAGPNDLCLAAEADDAESAEAALDAAVTLLEQAGARGAGPSGLHLPTVRSLRGALALAPNLNLALISVPGDYAAAEARSALLAGLNVMLFSDNVPLADEIRLKSLADERGLLCMGPDCGTALIGGLPLGFANRVRRGRIGLVAASGTGLQAVSCQIHQLGEGVSHALGCGGRDLSAEVGGRTTLAALRALAADPTTELLVVISKPGDAGVESQVLAQVASGGKPAVVHFLGRPAAPPDLPSGIVWAESLEDTARAAVALARGERAWRPPDPAAVQAEARTVAAAAGAGFLAGLFAGGTLAAEAAGLLLAATGQANQAASSLGELGRVGRHRIIDLGDDRFTRGRPHPVIDPTSRLAAVERSVAEGASLLLLDLVLGYGAHPNPAGALVPTLARARAAAEERGGRLEVLASVVGTADDPQSAAAQTATLRQVGVRVYDTPTSAARVAAAAAARLEAE